MSQLLLTSLYEDSGKGTFRLVGGIDLKRPPWFWPPVAEISCKQKKITYGGPPWGGNSEFRVGVQPKSPPGGWTDIVDQTEDGRKIIVGRIPHWDEFWSGSPPTNLKSEIPHADVEAFLNGLMRGMPMNPSAFFEDRPHRLYEALPPKMILGSFPSGPYREGGPRGPDPRYPLDPRRKDTVHEPRPGDSSNCWERICCIGLDVEKREVTAIVEITQSSGYGGPPCDSKSFISVGFWLVEPSWAEIESQTWDSEPFDNENDLDANRIECSRRVRFLGTSRFAISDVPRLVRSVQCQDQRWIYDITTLSFSSSLALRAEDLAYVRRCSLTPRLPVLHCVIAFNQVVENANFLGNGVRFGDYTQRVVQFPVSYPCRQMKPGNETVVIKDAVTKARPVHVANLPNGDILFFSGSIYGEAIDQPEGIYSTKDSVAIFRPRTNEIIPVEDPPFDIFCAGHSTLGNGNVVILGGTVAREEQHQHAVHWPGLKDVTVFDWRTSKFERLNYTMREGRWYPSTVVLGNGEVFICDGHPTLASIPHTNFDLEILSADGKRIVNAVENGNVSMGSADFTKFVGGENETLREEFQGLYPRMMLLPDGQVFSATSLRSLPTTPRNGVVMEEDRINMRIVENGNVWVSGRVFRDNSYVFNPQQPWVNRQVFEASKVAPDGHGPIWGFDDPAVLLPLEVNSTSDNVRLQPRVMTFLNGRDCTIEPLSAHPTWVHTKHQREESLDYLGARNGERRRRFGNMVLLPDGSVMVVGGSDDYHDSPTTTYYETRCVKEVEYFVPGSTPGEDHWRTDRLSQVVVPRQYHSSAILLLDGRVLVGGGNASLEYSRDYLNKEISFREIEIITPDYYQNGPQPEFQIDKDSVSYGDTISFSLLNSLTINQLSTKAIFIRCASFTHGFGYDQRAVRFFPYGSMTMARYNIRVPNNRNILPPGYYMVFVVSKEGVPSCGKMIKIG